MRVKARPVSLAAYPVVLFLALLLSTASSIATATACAAAARSTAATVGFITLPGAKSAPAAVAETPSITREKPAAAAPAASAVRQAPAARSEAAGRTRGRRLRGRVLSSSSVAGSTDGGTPASAPKEEEERRRKAKSALLGVFGERTEDGESAGGANSDPILACPATKGDLNDAVRWYGGDGPAALLVSYKVSEKMPGTKYRVEADYVDFGEPPKPARKMSRGESKKEGTFQSPVVTWMYERGWRNTFNDYGFPGIDEEFRQVTEYLSTTGADGGAVIDLSCGSGLMMRRLVASGRYSRVIGGDLSTTMLAEAARRFKQEDLGIPELIRCDVSKLPLKTESLDGVHAGAALHCWTKLEESISEVYRVLKPGKGFFATTFLTSGKPAVARKTADADGYKFFEMDELERLMRDAGFADVKVVQEGRSCAIVRATKAGSSTAVAAAAAATAACSTAAPAGFITPSAAKSAPVVAAEAPCITRTDVAAPTPAASAVRQAPAARSVASARTPGWYLGGRRLFSSAADTEPANGGTPALGDEDVRRKAKSALLRVFGEDGKSSGGGTSDPILACPASLGNLNDAVRWYGGDGPAALLVWYKASEKMPGTKYRVEADFVDFAEPAKPRSELSRADSVKEGNYQGRVVPWLYERGWRQNFNAAGFPGIDEEFRQDGKSSGGGTSDPILACPASLGNLNDAVRWYGGDGPAALLVWYKASEKMPGTKYRVEADFVDFAEPAKPRSELSRADSVKEGNYQGRVVPWLYERGWRQNFNAAGFPGIDEEFRQAAEYFSTTGADGGAVIDLSCGTGLMMRRLVASKMYSRVIGGDLSSTMLAEAARRFKQEDLGVPELIRCDVSKLPLKTESLDGVHAGAALHCWTKLEESISEVYRVLKQGKGFFATTFLTSAPSFGDSSTGDDGFKFFEVDELERLMRGAGFADVKVVQEGSSCAIVRATKGG
eukprot:g10203.t1